MGRSLIGCPFWECGCFHLACELLREMGWLLSGFFLELLCSRASSSETQVLSWFCFEFCFFITSFAVQLLSLHFLWIPVGGIIRNLFTLTVGWFSAKSPSGTDIYLSIYLSISISIYISRTGIPRNSNISVTWTYVFIFCCELIPCLSWSSAVNRNGRGKMRPLFVF